MLVRNVIGWIVLIFAGIIALCGVVLWLEKRFPSKQFDERQQVSRGRACGLGLGVGVVYFLVTMSILINQVDGEKTIEPYLLVFFGLMLETAVMCTYSLLTHSYLSFLQKPGLNILGFGFCGALQFLTLANRLKREGPLTLVGHGSSSWIFLIAGSCFLYLTLVLLIQQLRREKE